MGWSNDPERAAELGGRLAPVMAGVGLVSLLVNVVIYTALLRTVLRPAKGSAYPRIGRDELRVLGVVATGVLALFFYYVTGFAAVRLLLAGGEAGTLVAALVATALTALGVFALVRLLLAPAMTVADGRFSLRRAWPLSQGQFWGLLGMQVLACTLAAVVLVLASIVFTAVTPLLSLATGGRLSFTVPVTDMSSLDAFLTAPTLAALAFSAILTALMLAIILAPSAAAFRALADRVGAREG